MAGTEEEPVFRSSMTRRAMLSRVGRYTALAGVAMATPSLLSACSSDGATGSTGTTGTTGTPAVSDTTRATGTSGTSGATGSTSAPGTSSSLAKLGGQITIGIDTASMDPLVKMVPAFTEQTGITVKFDTGIPHRAGDQLTALVPQFQAGQAPCDLLLAGDGATPVFAQAGWLEPFTDAIPQAAWDDLTDGMTDYANNWCKFNGQVYRLPGTVSPLLYFGRQDILSSLGVDAPGTWDDIVSLGDPAKTKHNMYAFVDAIAKGGFAYNDISWLSLQAAGNVFKFDDGTQNAFKFLSQLIEKDYFPKSALAWTFNESYAAYLSDKSVTIRAQTDLIRKAQASKDWYKDDKVKVLLPPAGPNGERATWLGGYGLVIPKASKSVDQAKEFLAWLSLPAQMVATGADSNWFSPRHSQLEAFADTPLGRAYQAYTEAKVMKSRPITDNVSKAESVVETVLQSYLTGQMSLDDAVKSGRGQLG